MRALGYLLLIGGFLGGAFATALDTRHTDWMLFWPAAAIAVAGLLTIKRQASGFARSEAVLTANRAELGESLGNIVAVLEELQSSPPGSSSSLRAAIDQRLRGDLLRFADARESLVHLAGLQVYASIMSEFAAGERYINRVWSASADGYDHEAAAYLERATAQFRRAHAEFEAAGL